VNAAKAVAIYYAGRILYYVVVLLLAFSIVFFFLRLMPGDPMDVFIAALTEQGIRIEGEAGTVQLYREQFGLDEGLFTQFVLTMQRMLFAGDLGISSMNFGAPVEQLILVRLPWSVFLLGFAATMAWILGLIAGTLAGWFRETRAADWLYNFGIGPAQVPGFIVALMLVMIFPFGLGWFPTGGAYRAGLSPGLDPEFILSALHHAILPAMSMVLVGVFGWMLTTRALTIAILGDDYILYAEAKGLSKLRILYQYVLRNTVLPQVTAFALGLAVIVNGAYLVEWIFRYPGVGTLLISAINARDFNLVQGIVLLTIVAVLVANMIVDLLNPLIDPRIRTGMGQ
jgi:peptide/nickel transport system permease protein